MAALERDRASSVTNWTWFKCTENHCRAAEKENERNPPFRLTTSTCVWKKKLPQGENVVVDCAYSVPHNHFVANGKLYCFLSDVTNIRVKWRKLERQEIYQDLNTLERIFFPWRKLQWRIFRANTVHTYIHTWVWINDTYSSFLYKTCCPIHMWVCM